MEAHFLEIKRILKVYKEVFPEENKLIVFNSGIYHAVYNQTDVKRRIVINLNYESN